jgi:hypothetical protein
MKTAVRIIKNWKGYWTIALYLINPTTVKSKKSEAVSLHVMEAHGGKRGIAPTHTWPWHYMGVSGQQSRLGRALPSGKGPTVPIE